MKRFGVKIDLILRVDLVRPTYLPHMIDMILFQKSLGISEDDFDDLQSLFQVSKIFALNWSILLIYMFIQLKPLDKISFFVLQLK